MKTYICLTPNCKFESPTYYSMADHLIKIHKAYAVVNPPRHRIKCAFCEHLSNSEYWNKLHVVNAHQDKVSFPTVIGTIITLPPEIPKPQ